MAIGPRTSDSVMADILRTRRERYLEEYNVRDVTSLKSLLTTTVWQPTLQVDQTARVFRTMGSDTDKAPMDSLDSQTITLPVPIKKGLGGGITQDAIHAGFSDAEIQDELSSAIDAHKRLLNQWTMRAMLLDGQWWDATAAPPRSANNSMTSAHDHYLAYNVAGVPALTHLNAAYRHLAEHGPMYNPILMMNGYNRMLLGNQAEWISAVGAKTSFLDRLQEAGYSAIGQAGGFTIIENDYCPVNYMVALNAGGPKKPLAWRNAEVPGIPDTLGVWYDGPNAQYYLEAEYACWVGCAVQMRSLGVAIYLGSGTWADPTVTEWS